MRKNIINRLDNLENIDYHYEMPKQKRLQFIKARKAAGLKQNQLAPIIGKTQAWVSLVEAGAFNVSKIVRRSPKRSTSM